MYSTAASQYNKYHRMQDGETKLFCSSIVSRMDWSRECDDMVMDVGCGPGKSTRHILLPAYPDVRKIVAVDILPSMIAFAKENNAHPKIEYCEADLADRWSMHRWKNQITKVFSIYCLNWLKHQREGFQNIYDILQPGGEAALMFNLKSSLWDPYEELVSNPKWNKYLKDVEWHIPETTFMKDFSSHYKKMLGNIGFDIIVYEEEERSFTFDDDDEYKNSMIPLITLMNHIPDDLKDEFQDDLFQGIFKHNPRSSEGRPKFYQTALNLLLRKPKGN